MNSKITSNLQSGVEVSTKDFLTYIAKHTSHLAHLKNVPEEKLKKEEDYYPNSYTLQFPKSDLDNMLKAQALFLNKTDEELQETIRKSYEQRMKTYELDNNQMAAIIKNFKDILKRVEAWAPPTEDHNEIKELGIKTLKEYIKQYTDFKKKKLIKPVLKTIEEYRKETVEIHQKAIDAFKEGYEKEQKLLSDPLHKTRFLREFFESFKEEK